jgi:uncharacterized repeat protein (TIGR03803 family)
MNKLLTFLLILSSTFILSSFSLHAQSQTDLWGMTLLGGNGGGVIFKTDGNGENQQTVHMFLENPGVNPNNVQLCRATNGKLYGMTSSGGAAGSGVLFEYDPATSTYTKKVDFMGTSNGSNPLGSLILADNGKLYGMTSSGGANSYGVLFEYDPSTSTYVKKFDFTGAANGNNPRGSLIQASNGKLYGMTWFGGTSNLGVLFEYDLVTSTCTKKVDFTGTANGSYPSASLIQAGNGKLYGLTSNGGTSNNGVLFEFDTQTSTYTKKFDFVNATTGTKSFGSLLQAANGKLYGMTVGGGTSNYGVLFEYNITTATCTKKIDFTGTANGRAPRSTLMQAANGKIYGMTQYGGTSDRGVLFEYDTLTSTCTKKFDFTDATTGGTPLGTLLQFDNGKLYGVTTTGGAGNSGVIFEYDPGNSSYTMKIELTVATLGNSPYGSLMQASDGKLYGMTRQGGVNGSGTLFAFDPVAQTYSKKLDFDGTLHGSFPYGSLMQADNGKLYGMTWVGGANNNGVLFEYDPVSSQCINKLDFSSAVSGSRPQGSLMQAGNGKLYGLTYEGGANNYGVLFEYDPATSTYTKKFDFDGTTTGRNPQGSLMQAANGKIYGMTYIGGANGYGVLFEFDTLTSSCTKKIDFDGTAKGSNPSGALMQASNGKLYGMTYQGGTSNYGVLFEYDPGTSTYTKKIDFNGTAYGTYPQGSLMQASNGKLYGMAYRGGTNNYGVLFEFDPTTSNFTKKLDLTGTNGRDPAYANLIEICANPVVTSGPENISACENSGTGFSITATGNNLTFQWQVDDGEGFDNIPNNATYSSAQSATLNVTGVAMSMNGFTYRCLVTSACPVSSIYSDTAILTVNSRLTFYRDADSDGYGNPLVTTLSCSAPAGYVANHTDCDDTNSGIHPGATDIPGDGIDQDCNGTDACTCYADADHDGYGDSGNAFVSAEGVCYAPNASALNTDCDDTNSGIHPGATDIPGDGIDQDCNGIDACTCYADADHDGYGDAENSFVSAEGVCYAPNASALNTDCDDTDNSIYPGAPEIYSDGIDQDCDGTDVCTCYTDADHDGYGDPDDSFVSPDGQCHAPDASALNTDCDDSDASIHPSASERCNGKDDDCDGDTDEDLIRYDFTEAAEICSGDIYLWHGNNYSAPGSYYDSLVTLAGCDSLFELNLTVITVNILLTVTDTAIIANAEGAAYQWLDCDNNYLPLDGATEQVFPILTSGNIAVEVTENGCADTSECVLVSPVAIIENSFNHLILFPNPTNGLVTLDMGSEYELLNITLYDLQGNRIKNEDLSDVRRVSFNLSGPAGLYLIRISSGDKNASIKLIKQ